MPSAALCSVAMNLCSDFERDGVDPRIRGLLGLPVHPQLGRERVERSFGRIAFHLPDAFLLEQLRIVAEQWRRVP